MDAPKQHEEHILTPVDESELPAVRDTAIPASHPSFGEVMDPLSDEEPVKNEPAPDKGQAAKQGEGQPELLVGKFKTTDELANAYRELESHSTRVTQELATYKKPKVEPELQEPAKKSLVIPQGLKDRLFDKTDEAIVEIVKLARDSAVEEVRSEATNKSRKDEVNEVRGWFSKEHGDLATNRQAMLAIEGMAAEAEGTSMLVKFQNAAKTFKEMLNGQALQATEEARAKAADTQKQVDAAVLPEPKKASGNGRKTYKRSDIDRIMEHDPAQYQRMQGEIVKAMREGRVREDL